MKKFLITLVALFLFASTAFTQTDYEALAKSGSTDEIKYTLRKDTKLPYRGFGSENENFLMLVLKNDRPVDIVKLCLSAEIDAGDKNKNGMTGVMYACKYASDPKTVEAVVTSGTILGIGVGGRLKAKDSSGKNAYDYAKENKNPEIYRTINALKKDPAVVKAEKEAAKLKKEETSAAEAEPADRETNPASENTSELKTAESLVLPSPPQKNLDETFSDIPEAKVASSSLTEVPPVIPAPPVKEVKAPEPEIQIPSPEPQKKNEPQKYEYKSYSKTFLYDYAIRDDFSQNDDSYKTPSKISEPNLADKNGVTLLMKAAKAGNDWDVQNLISSGADVNLRDKDGWSALMYAVRYQNSINLVNNLIDNGAHIRVRNRYNATPLLLASDYSQNPKIIERLLKDRNAGEDEVFRAFILCVTSNQGEDHVKEAKITLFLKMDVPLNRLWKGKTPLMYACQYSSSTKTIKTLLDNGARPGIQDADGKTAFDYAKLNSNLPHDDIFWSLNSSER
ncbi:MAG: ankyrin repeat domain-containing protein [Treponema sp.]|nr:ankyrin repeat domain-containing protein [Treponema sp.]